MSVINLNFVPGHEKQIVILSRILLIVGMFFAAIGAYLALNSGIYIDRMIPLEKRIVALRSELVQHKENLLESPSPSDVEELSDRIKMLSSKLNLSGLWVGDLLYEIEATIPDKAYLLQFHYPYEGNTARILIRAESENMMSQALKRMEKSEQISNIVLAGQTREAEGLQVVIADVRFSLQRFNQ